MRNILKIGEDIKLMNNVDNVISNIANIYGQTELDFNKIEDGKYKVHEYELHLWEDNYFDITDTDIEMLMVELKDGLDTPLLVDARNELDEKGKSKRGRVWNGNKRLIAIKRLIENGEWLDKDGNSTDYIWVEPRMFKSDAQAIKKTLINNGHYGKVNRKKVKDLSDTLLNSDEDLNTIPVVLGDPINFFDFIDNYETIEVNEAATETNDETSTDFKEKKPFMTKCPKCEDIFDAKRYRI